MQLQRSISSALECNNFIDLYDEEDALEEGVAFVPSVCQCNFKRGRVTLYACMTTYQLFHDHSIYRS